MTPAPQRENGRRSREAILGAAARLATVEGINGLTIGRLADEVGMSKSGLFAHFGSKEELQLATVEHAREIFEAQVIEPVDDTLHGVARARALTEGFLAHIEGGVFPGGCFFASVAAELDAQVEGPVRERVLEVESDYLGRIRDAAVEAQQLGELAAGEDIDQVVFEINAFLLLAQMLFVIEASPAPLERARRSIARALGSKG